MLFDTNVVSEFLRSGAAARFPKLDQLVRDALEAEDLKIAFITQFELLRLGLKQELQLRVTRHRDRQDRRIVITRIGPS
jgi:predicted nucleic acid-binding protein